MRDPASSLALRNGLAIALRHRPGLLRVEALDDPAGLLRVLRLLFTLLGREPRRVGLRVVAAEVCPAAPARTKPPIRANANDNNQTLDLRSRLRLLLGCFGLGRERVSGRGVAPRRPLAPRRPAPPPRAAPAGPARCAAWTRFERARSTLGSSRTRLDVELDRRCSCRRAARRRSRGCSSPRPRCRPSGTRAPPAGDRPAPRRRTPGWCAPAATAAPAGRPTRTTVIASLKRWRRYSEKPRLFR